MLLFVFSLLLFLLQIIPADLNAFLYQLERNIAWAANLTGNNPAQLPTPVHCALRG
jgi:hypothetical protein